MKREGIQSFEDLRDFPPSFSGGFAFIRLFFRYLFAPSHRDRSNVTGNHVTLSVLLASGETIDVFDGVVA